LAKTSPTPVKIMGIPDEPAVTGSQQEIFAYYGLNAQGIADACCDLLEKFQK
jgi:transketolase